ncbi:hypothetical protein VTO73DRAFT_9896 [Trametes versicolor]
MVSVNLRRRLQDVHCGDKDHVGTHFAKMRTIREDLAAMGQPPSKDDLYAIILGSMPLSYKPYLSVLSAATRATDQLLSPDQLRDAEYLAKQGTKPKITTYDTPEYNGVTEHENRTVMEKGRALLNASGLLHVLGGEATHRAIYLKNRTPTRALNGRTPYECFWNDRTVIARWIRFDEETDAHRIYWPEHRIITVERSARFNLRSDPLDVEVPPLEEEQAKEKEDSTHQSEWATSLAPDLPTVPSTPEPRKKRRTSHTRPKYLAETSILCPKLRTSEGNTTGRAHDQVLPRGVQAEAESAHTEELSDKTETAAVAFEQAQVAEEELAMAAAIGEAECIEPAYKEAKKRPDWSKWEEAIGSDIENPTRNGTWEIVDHPRTRNVVQSKWVLRIKKNAAGEIDKYKACLVMCGFTQVYGVDYYETLEPVAKLSSIRLLLASAVRNDWPAEIFAFNSAYLNSKLNKDRKHVLKLKRALYGLERGGRKWYEPLCAALADLGFLPAEADYGVFFKCTGSDLAVLAIHVDEGLIIASVQRLLDACQTAIGAKYKLTELRPVSWLLGMKILRGRANCTLALSQHARVFPYLLGTKRVLLVDGGAHRGLEGFVHVDGASQEHRPAITRYVFLVNGGAILRASKKQELVTLSIAESEYVAAMLAAKEALWLRRLIGKSTIALTEDGSYHTRTKHIYIRYHFIRYYIQAGSICLIYCPTEDITANTLTKALPSVKVKHFASALGLVADGVGVCTSIIALIISVFRTAAPARSSRPLRRRTHNR